MNTIDKFIAVVRDSFIGSQQVYTEGSCYHFHLILKEVFPEAVPYYDADHVLTEIEGKFYDITGEVSQGYAHLMNEQASYNLKAPYNIYKPIH